VLQFHRLQLSVTLTPNLLTLLHRFKGIIAPANINVKYENIFIEDTKKKERFALAPL